RRARRGAARARAAPPARPPRRGRGGSRASTPRNSCSALLRRSAPAPVPTTTISKTNAVDAPMPGAAEKPSYDCPLCPRLQAFREELRGREPTWFNAPVPEFGLRTARLLIVGLAPGMHGANRTGRPFTGDYAGVLLYD